MNCKIIDQYEFDCLQCPHWIETCDWDDCEEGYCGNKNEDDFEEDVWELTY